MGSLGVLCSRKHEKQVRLQSHKNKTWPFVTEWIKLGEFEVISRFFLFQGFKYGNVVKLSRCGVKLVKLEYKSSIPSIQALLDAKAM